jgi:hypothetical protein
LLTVVIPAASIDGQRHSYPIRAVSLRSPETVASREIALVTSAPLLRAVIRPEKVHLKAGEQLAYAVTLLNVGSATAADIALRLSCPEEFEPLDGERAGFRRVGTGELVLDGIGLVPGSFREAIVTFRVKEGTRPGQEFSCRLKLENRELGTWDSYRSKGVLVHAP